MKNFIIKKISICFITIIILLLLYIYPEYNNSHEVSNESISYNTIYLLYNNLLTQTKTISNTNDQVKEIITSLTKNSNIYIDSNYQKLIPENTTIIDYKLDNNTLTINFSKELLNTNINEEEYMIESIIYSLTELDNINNIIILVEGNKLNKLPISKQNLPTILNRKYGINKIYNITKLNPIYQNTLYYYTLSNNEDVLVPVTIYSNDNINKVEIIIEELKSSPITNSNLMSFLNNHTKLLDYEILENEIKLEFNNNLISTLDNKYITEEVKYAINLSLKDSLNYDNVSFFTGNNEF